MNTKRFLFVGLLIATLIVAACSTKPTTTATTEVLTPVLTKTEVPTVSGNEVPVGFTEEGAPYRGNPDAPVTLVEHSEFQ
jgi:hypothetical protein